MPPRLASPVLTVDAGKIANVDPRNVENLFGMWTVFSKCAESLEEGRRLENLSWRLWNRETFCCEPEEHSATTQRIQKKSRRDPDDIPELSASVDSAASDEMEHIESHTKSVSGAVDIKRPPFPRRESTESRSRGKEKHITSLHLERMVMTIKENKELEPFSPRRSTAPARTAKGTTGATPRPPPTTPTVTKPSLPTASSSESESAASQGVSSESSATSDALSGHSIVRGFSPGHVSSSYRSHTRLAPVVPRPAHVQVEVNKKKTGTIFMLGASSGEEESSLEEHMSTTFHLQQQQQRSSLSEGLKKPQRKRTSFKDDVSTRTVYEGTHEDDTEEDEEVVSESAIDDDSSDWEDSVTESGRSSVDEKEMFQRVDSRPNLTSRRSLLSTLLHQPDRAAAIQNAASRSTPAMRSRTSSPNGPSVSTTPEEESALTMRGPQIPRSRPIIMTTSSIHPPALSPRTTRRNMLATELTESLRRHLLWERQQKNTTASAVLKRRHTSHDVPSLQEYPGQDMSPDKDASKNNSWNYFDHGLGEYHQKGW